MSLDPKLAASLIDGCASNIYAPKRLLGVRVRKFCLWHQIQLKALDSPFMSRKPATWRDLRIAIGICRTKFRNSDIRKPWLIPGILWTVALFRGRTREALAVQIDAFLDYCGDYLQDPDHAIIPPDRSPDAAPRIPRKRAPDQLEHVSDIVAWMHCDDEKIWNMPLGYANWLRLLALRAGGGDIDFVTEAERKIQEELPEEYRRR